MHTRTACMCDLLHICLPAGAAGANAALAKLLITFNPGGGEGGGGGVAVGQLATQAPAAVAKLTCPCMHSSQHAALR